MTGRALTAAERQALPPGLLAAVPDDVVLVNAHHPLSRLSKLVRGYAVILVRGRRVFWPDLPEDLSRHPVQLAVLAHELVHVWQYAHGMTLLSYIVRDVVMRLGRYDYRLVDGKPYTAYGYEQQAAMMEDWVRLTHGQLPRYSGGRAGKDALAHLLPFV